MNNLWKTDLSNIRLIGIKSNNICEDEGHEFCNTTVERVLKKNKITLKSILHKILVNQHSSNNLSRLNQKKISSKNI